MIRTVFALVCLASAAWAGPAEPLAFKGVALGSPVTAVAADPRYDCRATNAPAADRICSLRPQEQETIAGAPVNSIFWFSYRGRITSIAINLDERHFSGVVTALQAKYGPGEAHSESVKNLKGAAFENRIHLWRQASGSLQAQRYAGRLDKSSIRFVDDAAVKAIEAQRLRGSAAPASDL